MAYFRTADLTEIPITTVVTTVTDAPLVLYNTWATELGLSTTATVYYLDDDDNVWGDIDINGYFLEGYQTVPTTNASFSSEGGFGFYLNPIADAAFNTQTGLTGISRMGLLVDRPDVFYAFHPIGLDCKTTGVKVQKTANTTIMSGTISLYSSSSPFITFATRFEANKITMVCSAVTTAVDHRLRLYTRGTTTTYLQTLELTQAIGDVRKLVFTVPAVSFYSFSGNITETSPIDTWRITTSKCSTSEVINTTTVTGAAYSMTSKISEPCNITIAPKIDYQWSANKIAVLGDFVTPSSPDTTPHLFKVTIAGTFGTTESSWNLTGTTTQGTATLTYVAALVNPVSIGPKLGTLVSI